MGVLKVRWRVAVVLGALLAATLEAQTGPQGDGTEVIDDLEIFLAKPGPVKEGVEVQFVVRLDKRPLKTGGEGYRPAAGVPTSWEPEVNFHWNFGDGTGWISTEERPSITHRYKEIGIHTLEVEARSLAGKVEGSLPVVVQDRDYFNPTISAIQIDPAQSTYELTAEIFNPSQDEIDITWSVLHSDAPVPFPSQAGPDLWRIRRTFPPGRHEVEVAWKGDDGTEKTTTIEINNSGPPPDFSNLEELDEKVVLDGVRSRLEASFAGGLPAEKLAAEIRPFVGNFLGPTGKEGCRFMMTAWDPELLVMLQLIANVPLLPEEGVSFQYDGSNVTLTAQPNAKEYLEAYEKSGFNNAVLAGLKRGEEKARDLGKEPPSEGQINTELRKRKAGVQSGEREKQSVGGREITGAAPASVSPLSSEEEAYGGVEGTVQIKFVPDSRIVGVLDVHLQGGTKFDRSACSQGRPYMDYPPDSADQRGRRKVVRGTCKELTLKGSFVLDLEAAPRDGLVRYGTCDEPRFEIEGVYGPEPGERHVSWRRPRISVDFDRKFDPETLNGSTFQLVYRDPSGNAVPVETRIHRDAISKVVRNQAFLKPVEPLWGGVKYTARIKTGEDGVRGLNGGFLKAEDLEDADERLDSDGWYVLREFWTRLDFVPKPGRLHNVSCHVWQGARDAPLIVGKPAVAQVDASWQKNPRVHPADQTEELPARVLLKKREGDSWIVVAGSNHAFKRPDLRPPPDKFSRHTANLTFTPDRSLPETLSASLVVDRKTRENELMPRYFTLCSTPVWEHEPELTIELVPVAGVAIPEYHAEEAEYDYLEVRARALRLDLARVYPLASVRARVGDPLDVARPDSLLTDNRLVDTIQAVNNIRIYKRRIDQALQERADVGDADLIIAFAMEASPRSPVPHTVTAGLAESYPARIVHNMMLEVDEMFGSLLHQIGHVLGLADVPHGGVETATLRRIAPSHVWDGDPLEWHDGFASALLAIDGIEFRFYTSRIGDFNQVPLMHPARGARADRLLLRHHYLRAMETIEDSPLSEP